MVGLVIGRVGSGAGLDGSDRGYVHRQRSASTSEIGWAQG